MKVFLRYLIILNSLLIGCSRQETPKREADLYDFKIDSVVKEIFKAKDFPDEKLVSYSKSKDSLGFINELAPLSKKVYYPYLDLSLEYRNSFDDHRRYQIIVCYNKDTFVGIPFYWQRINDSLKLDLFENKLNIALKIFYNQDKHGSFLQFQRTIVNSIFNDLSVYKILPLWASDSATLIKKMGRWNHETKCLKNATESIRQIYRDKDEETEYFVLPINDCQLKIKYTKDGIELTEINYSCFSKLIF